MDSQLKFIIWTDNESKEIKKVVDDKPIVDDGMGNKEIEFFMINDTHGAFADGEYANVVIRPNDVEKCVAVLKNCNCNITDTL